VIVRFKWVFGELEMVNSVNLERGVWLIDHEICFIVNGSQVWMNKTLYLRPMAVDMQLEARSRPD
jgi:hypothetical protein